MELDVGQAFKKPGDVFPFEVTLALPPQDVTGDTVSFDELSLAGEYSVLDDAVVLTGTLTTTAHAPCARCMGEALIPLRIAFHEAFRKDANETEDECFRFEGKAVPLDQMALTLVMLNLPMRFLCKEGCEGSEAWREWQKTVPKSSCEDGQQIKRPFEALQHLLTKDEEV